jgi:hypothetical protein
MVAIYFRVGPVVEGIFTADDQEIFPAPGYQPADLASTAEELTKRLDTNGPK